jgi:hypothetical protein
MWKQCKTSLNNVMMYIQQCHLVGGYVGMRLDERCLTCERKGDVFHILHPNQFVHEELFDPEDVPHVFVIGETHHRHQIYV